MNIERRSVRSAPATAGGAVVVSLLACLAVSTACGRGGGPSAGGSVSEPAGTAGETSPAGMPQPKKDDGTPVVLRIGEVEYSAADFEASYRTTLGGETIELEAETLSRLYDEFIREKILLAAARAENITVSDDDVRKAASGFAAADRGPNDAASGEADVSRALIERLLVEKYTRQALRDVTVSEAEVAAYYEANKRDFLLPERIKVSQVLFKSEQEAVQTLRRLQTAGESDFKTAARELSIGPEAGRGGELGVFKAGDLPADVEKVVFALTEGRISSVFESSYGFHIFRVDQRFPPELLPLDQAAPAIRNKLLERKRDAGLDARVAALKTSLDWTSYPERLPFPYQRNSP